MLLRSKRVCVGNEIHFVFDVNFLICARFPSMFNPKTERIGKFAELHKKTIEQIESLFVGRTNLYIDYANVRPWADKLEWHIDLKRLKQFLDSFDNIKSVNFYHGTLRGDTDSEEMADSIKKLGFSLKTKDVKIMRQFIDYTSIKPNSPALLGKFIRKCLLMKYDLETVEYLNRKFKELNDKGQMYIEDRKCNFDVEIGRDMLLDFERSNTDTFVLWSGDSDFFDPIYQLLKDKKKVVLFATAGKVSKELSKLSEEGLFIFDIQKIKDFICWKKEISAL